MPVYDTIEDLNKKINELEQAFLYRKEHYKNEFYLDKYTKAYTCKLREQRAILENNKLYAVNNNKRKREWLGFTNHEFKGSYRNDSTIHSATLDFLKRYVVCTNKDTYKVVQGNFRKTWKDLCNLPTLFDKTA